MNHESIALDIKVARQKSGLRQVDCAHLLGVSETRVSAIENGRSLPNVREIATLSVVYGKPIESLLAGLLDETINSLVANLRSVPKVGNDTRGTFNRAHTLSQLAIRLEALTSATDGG